MIVEAGELRGDLDSPLCNMEVANGKRNNDPNVETHRFSIGHSHHWLRCGCREPIPLAVGAGGRDADPCGRPISERYVYQR